MIDETFADAGATSHHRYRIGEHMQKSTGEKKIKCKNCEGTGFIKLRNSKVKCQRCGGTGAKR
jgi:DnaJ-class molecular chaperone